MILSFDWYNLCHGHNTKILSKQPLNSSSRKCRDCRRHCYFRGACSTATRKGISMFLTHTEAIFMPFSLESLVIELHKTFINHLVRIQMQKRTKLRGFGSGQDERSTTTEMGLTGLQPTEEQKGCDNLQ